jgi:single-stranded DNA-binding protein
MSLHIVALATLIAGPVSRTSAAGKDFATATFRVSADDGAMLVSAIAFGGQANDLLRHQQGSSGAISGRAKATEWQGRDGKLNHHLSVVIEQIASAGAARRAERIRRAARAAA